MIDNWKTLDTELIGNFRIFDLYKHIRRHPKTNKDSTFYGLITTDWVNIIPLTKDNEVILVEQYRHGINKAAIELPAGLIEKDEDPRIAAQRECQEETGYIGKEKAILLGKVQANPAFLNNFCHHYLWLNCELKHEQNLDENEHINVLKVNFETFEKMIASGDINHSLVTSALYYYSKYLSKM